MKKMILVVQYRSPALAYLCPATSYPFSLGWVDLAIKGMQPLYDRR
jgi:hypothetical protein